MGICFAGLTSVVGASPLDTIPPPITDFFIPVNQRSVEPIRNPGDFIGRVFAPKPGDRQPPRSEAQPITGVTVTIASGPRAGESVATNPSGYYRFPNVKGDELHLRVEKEHFEPKEVRVHRSRPTILANGDVPNYTRDPQQHPGNILMGTAGPTKCVSSWKKSWSCMISYMLKAAGSLKGQIWGVFIVWESLFSIVTNMPTGMT